MKLTLPKVGEVWLDRLHLNAQVVKLHNDEWIQMSNYSLSFFSFYSMMKNWGWRRYK